MPSTCFQGREKLSLRGIFGTCQTSSSSSFNWSSKRGFYEHTSKLLSTCNDLSSTSDQPMLLPKLSYTSLIVGLTFCFCTLFGVMANKKISVQHSTIFEEFVPISLSQKNRGVRAVPINCWKNGQKVVWCSERSRL